MWYLVRKDISLVIKQVWTYLALGILLSAVFSASDSTMTMLLTFLAVSVWNFAARICYLEEKNHTYGFLWTLPCSRSQFVISKYVSVLVFWLISVGVLAGASAVYPLIGITETNVFPLGMALAWSSPFLVLIGLYILLVFRFGYFKASTHIRLLFLVFFIPLVIPKQLLGSLTEPLSKLLNSSAINYLMPLGIVLVYLLFMSLAVSVFERKELTTLE